MCNAIEDNTGWGAGGGVVRFATTLSGETPLSRCLFADS